MAPISPKSVYQNSTEEKVDGCSKSLHTLKGTNYNSASPNTGMNQNVASQFSEAMDTTEGTTQNYAKCINEI